jgi:hypothetical protein
MSSLQNLRVVHQTAGAVYVRLPPELQKSAGRCDCPVCKGSEGFWDTLAIPIDPVVQALRPTTWTVHAPEWK